MGLGGQRHAPAALPPGKRHGTHCIGGWVGPRAGLKGYGKSRPHQVAIPTTLSRPNLTIFKNKIVKFGKT